MSLISRQRLKRKKKKGWKKRPINGVKSKWKGCIVESSWRISKHQQIKKIFWEEEEIEIFVVET